jgi:hypothetical protein
MIIKIGDTITDDTGRTGELKSIGIATDKSDVAGELGLKAKEYDTDLNYTGAITFGTNWCYFYQIRKVNNNDINIDLTDWIGF